jgi:hypothetical protein
VVQSPKRAAFRHLSRIRPALLAQGENYSCIYFLIRFYYDKISVMWAEGVQRGSRGGSRG